VYGVHLAAGDVKLLDRVLEVNLQSVVHASRALLPHLISTSLDFRRVREPTLLRDDGVAVEASSGKPAARGTTLIIISSMIAQQLALFPGHAAYIASKMGVAGWADGVFAEVRQCGVRVCTIFPSLVSTGGWSGLLFPQLVAITGHKAAGRLLLTREGCTSYFLLAYCERVVACNIARRGDQAWRTPSPRISATSSTGRQSRQSLSSPRTSATRS
jgi:short-subunit dehydrogenase